MKTIGLAVVAALGFAAIAQAAEVEITDAYARSATPTSPTGAAYFQMRNTGDQPDRLVAVQSQIAARVELHSHQQDANGMMRMVEIEEGIALAPGASHLLERGGDHVMLMGLTGPLVDGESFDLILIFEQAGEISVSVPVDQTRRAKHSH